MTYTSDVATIPINQAAEISAAANLAGIRVTYAGGRSAVYSDNWGRGSQIIESRGRFSRSVGLLTKRVESAVDAVFESNRRTAAQMDDQGLVDPDQLPAIDSHAKSAKAELRAALADDYGIQIT